MIVSITQVAENISPNPMEMIMIIVARIDTGSKVGVAHGFLAGRQRSLCGRLDRMRRDVRETYEPVQCEACDRKLSARRSKPAKGLDGLY